MNVLIVDDEPLVLQHMMKEIRTVFGDEAEIKGLTNGKSSIEYVRNIQLEGKKLDYAFLDMQLMSMTGIQLAKLIKEIQPSIKIIFCTAHCEYAMQAYQVHALGYLLKPVSQSDIEEVLDAINRNWRVVSHNEKKRVRVQTFGNFDVFVDEKLLTFERQKSKELLAYLIDRRGGTVTTAQIASVLWEDREDVHNVVRQVQTIISSLKKTLRNAGVEDILIKTWNHLAIDQAKIDCDIYNFYAGDSYAVNSYRGEYMMNYSWAEFTNAELKDTGAILLI